MSLYPRCQRGFSLTELMVVVAIAGSLMAMSVPIVSDVTDASKLTEAARLVERELQDARLHAVSANRSLRVRTNCPAAGYVRTVEVLNADADTAANRCLNAAFPFPPDDDVMTRPNYDGPVRTIPNSAAVTTSSIEFAPDGTARLVVGGVAQAIATTETLTITRNGRNRTLTINGAGKIQLQ
jgi:prepilin-type N-terminal cleavage/methylation domain-containing protein